ncbi:MAG TPA: histidine kinase [Flavilitoribacter sp.]|nr:histidine kinase [Flavilitoribacter sp.]HMQ87496.1 histidine kinase [Flavilitoribacter sp.]
MELTISNSKNIQTRAHLKTLAIHTGFWVLYVVSEYFANQMHRQLSANPQFFRTTLLSLPVMIIPTYFIALFAAPRYLKAKRWGLFLLCALAAAIFVLYGRIKWLALINYFESGDFYQVPVSKVLKNVIRDYAIIALGVCIYIIGDYRRQQQTNERLIKAKAEAEIQLLKGQLHPHFLFNSLNNIYSLALSRSEYTADSILKLTELLDYLVYRAGMEKVALNKEIELVENYIGLEELRYGSRLKVDLKRSVSNESLQVAPLILLPFAENCFKHGGIGKDGLFRVEINLEASDSRLLFLISNTKNHRKKNLHASGGVGLKNIRQRLELLYPGKYRLTIREEPETFKVELEIKFK